MKISDLKGKTVVVSAAVGAGTGALVQGGRVLLDTRKTGAPTLTRDNGVRVFKGAGIGAGIGGVAGVAGQLPIGEKSTFDRLTTIKDEFVSQGGKSEDWRTPPAQPKLTRKQARAETRVAGWFKRIKKAGKDATLGSAPEEAQKLEQLIEGWKPAKGQERSWGTHRANVIRWGKRLSRHANDTATLARSDRTPRKGKSELLETRFVEALRVFAAASDVP